ncbi:fumarylacetoacetate hydrolase family protein [Variovorax sp. LT1R16]|uniref:fumarylacetoacetate hydrolase family protein n=1 Tax=Variovorax sp. LT1R16 TaxID=3443728 RepID=UPI003F48AF38
MKRPVHLRLATRRNGRRDGELMLVSPATTRWVSAGANALTLQALLDDWHAQVELLSGRCHTLDACGWAGTETFDASQAMAPLPRAFQWADASVYRNHARLIYKWRNQPIPPGYEDEPLVYQGGSDVMLGPEEDIVAGDEAHQIDLEAEIAVITTDVPMGASPAEAADCIALVVLLNDVSLRGLIPQELAKGFGFYQSKPATSFAPVAVTPAALGNAWQDGMPNLRVRIDLNGQRFGEPHANTEAIFNFGEIIAHLARTRRLVAGSIVGAGTISNEDEAAGSACITEARVRQILAGADEGSLQSYLRHGDRVRIESTDDDGRTVFGAIDQQVTVVRRPPIPLKTRS